MTPELESFRDQVRRFMQAEVAPQRRLWAKQQHVDRATWRKAGALGLLLTDIPPEHGGAGGNFAHQAIVVEELSAIGDTAFGIPVHGIVARYLLKHGHDDQRNRYLPLLANGQMIGALAMTEPGAGSDLQSIRCRAVRDGNDYVLTGAKTFISNGRLADLILVVARTSNERGAKGLSLILVETNGAKGYRVDRVLEKIGQNGQDTAELSFEDVRVPGRNVLGGEAGRGFYQIMEELPYERVIIAIIAVAAMERAVRLTVEHVRNRSVFGKPLMEMQNCRFTLAEAETQAVVARTFVDRCVAEMIAGQVDAVTASMAKYWTTDLQCQVIDNCLQLFGGYGYMLEYPIAQMYADARVQRIYGGANEIMKEVIARSLFADRFKQASGG